MTGGPGAQAPFVLCYHCPFGGRGGPPLCAGLVTEAEWSRTKTAGAGLQKGTLVTSHSALVSWCVK